MQRRWFSILAGLSLIATMLAPTLALAASEPPQWAFLGSKEVGFGADRDVIDVGRDRGVFSKIRLQVRNNDIALYDLKVVFLNGDAQNVAVREEIKAGGTTRAIDLKSGNRGIRSIELVYRTVPGKRAPAVVDVFGLLPKPVARKPGDWELLGAKSVDLGIDRDVINVGGRQGLFDKLRFRVNDNGAVIYDIKIIYGNGGTESIQANQTVAAGAWSKTFDIRGDGRRIHRIELVYRATAAKSGRALIEVYGQEPAGAKTVSEGWELIGVKSVAPGADRDVIQIGQSEGLFKRLQLRALNNSIAIYDMKVVFGNGEVEKPKFPEMLRAGTTSTEIQLTGKHRFIRHIELVYRALDANKGRAVIEVFGWQSVPQPAVVKKPEPLAGWERLGTKRVDQSIDRDVVEVGYREGRFNRIKLRALENPIVLYELTVVYGDSTRENISVDAVLRPNRDTRDIDLAGKHRFIQRIELIYRTMAGARGGAVIEVYGRPSNRADAGPAKPIKHAAWQSLGRKAVDLNAARDTIGVGIDKGKFRSLKLRVGGNDVHILGVTIRFGNGKRRNFNVDRVIGAGTETREVTLENDGRHIREINVLYKPPRPGATGRATVEVLGLKS